MLTIALIISLAAPVVCSLALALPDFPRGRTVRIERRVDGSRTDTYV